MLYICIYLFVTDCEASIKEKKACWLNICILDERHCFVTSLVPCVRDNQLADQDGETDKL